MAKFTPFRGKLVLENADFNRKVDQSGRHVQKFAKDTQQSLDGSTKSAKQLSTEILAMSAAAVGSITLVVNKLKELEADLLLVQYAWTDMGQAGRDAVRLIAQEQAKLTGSAVSDVVKVQTALSNQGIDPRSSGGQALTNVVANFADATGKSHAGVIDSLSPGSIATGASHQRLLDVFAAVGSKTRGGLNAGFDLLGQFMPALAPTGSALGLDESELAALLGTASWHTPRARRAGSGIRMVLEEAVKPDSKFAKAFAETFEMSLDEAVAGRGLTGLIEAFERAMTAWGDRGFIGSFGSAETGSLAKAVVGDQQRLQTMLQAAQQSAGAAERINEQYEGTLKQTAGVLGATFESAQLNLGKIFEGPAIAWMEALTEILDDDNLVKAAGDFLEAATLLADPMRELVVPITSFAAALLSAEVGGLSVAEIAGLYFAGKGVGKAWQLGKKGIQGASALNASLRGGAGVGTGTIAAKFGGERAALAALSGGGAGLGALALGALGPAAIASIASGSTPDAIRQDLLSETDEVKFVREAVTVPRWDRQRREIMESLGVAPYFEAGFSGQLAPSGEVSSGWQDRLLERAQSLYSVPKELERMMENWIENGKFGENVLENFITGIQMAEIAEQEKTATMSESIRAFKVFDYNLMAAADAAKSAAENLKQVEQPRTTSFFQSGSDRSILEQLMAQYQRKHLEFSPGGINSAEWAELDRIRGLIERQIEQGQRNLAANEETADNTAPQQSISLYYSPAISPDDLLTGG